MDIMCLYMKEVRTMTNRAHMLMQDGRGGGGEFGGFLEVSHFLC